MRFITEFELAEGNSRNARLSIEARKDSEMKIGFAIGNAFGWESSEDDLRHKIGIEAFPMDKWMEFKKLFNQYYKEAYLGKCDPMHSLFNIGNALSELESCGENKDQTKDPV